jgi:YfiH family protein
MVAAMHPDWLRPDCLPPQVGAVMSTREGGCSQWPWERMNLGAQVGDEPGAVASNRRAFAEAIGAVPVFLEQVHGARVVRVSAGDAATDAVPHRADASVTTEPGVACTVLVADCLPLLFAAPEGRAVAAAHAGWRGLAGGVVEAALRCLCEAACCPPADVQVWLGACIGPHRFEVGADVLRAFGADLARPDRRRFAPRGGDLAGKWLADLPLLARDRLSAAGVHAFSGGAGCTATQASRFFSYRRDGVTGRMAAAIWIRR